MVNSTGVLTESFTPHEKAAAITWLIAGGAEFTTPEIAERLGVTFQGAHYLMHGISRVIPITQERGRWRRFEAR